MDQPGWSGQRDTVMGMGLPTSAVYVLLSIVLAPALVKMGIEPLAGHMFIFYLGMMSFLTPPVAISSYTAAGIAKTDMWTTSVDAIRIVVAPRPECDERDARHKTCD